MVGGPGPRRCCGRPCTSGDPWVVSSFLWAVSVSVKRPRGCVLYPCLPRRSCCPWMRFIKYLEVGRWQCTLLVRCTCVACLLVSAR